jgi:hypothetical protein
MSLWMILSIKNKRKDEIRNEVYILEKITTSLRFCEEAFSEIQKKIMPICVGKLPRYTQIRLNLESTEFSFECR